MNLTDLYNDEDLVNKMEEEYQYYIWEEQDYKETKLMYEYGLEGLEELPTKEKHVKTTKEN